MCCSIDLYHNEKQVYGCVGHLNFNYHKKQNCIGCYLVMSSLLEYLSLFPQFLDEDQMD